MKKILIIIALIVAIGLVMYAKRIDTKSKTEVIKSVETRNDIPRLLDLGADKCMACKAMDPVLEKLRKEFKGKLQVDFMDVWKNSKEVEKYKVQSIPTQIFFDANGKELYRHIGFISEEDILKKWKELGIKLK